MQHLCAPAYILYIILLLLSRSKQCCRLGRGKHAQQLPRVSGMSFVLFGDLYVVSLVLGEGCNSSHAEGSCKTFSCVVSQQNS
jgi:hypothetical protein